MGEWGHGDLPEGMYDGAGVPVSGRIAHLLISHLYDGLYTHLWYLLVHSVGKLWCWGEWVM